MDMFGDVEDFWTLSSLYPLAFFDVVLVDSRIKMLRPAQS